MSIAIPLFNEAEVVPELLRRTRAVLDELPGGPHELVIADDGSSDATPALLADAVEADERITAVTLSRNFGHQAALTAALDHASGDVVVLMDGDLQDAPEEIPRFLDAWRDGSDVVYAVRVDRPEGLLLRLCFAAFYRLIAIFSETKLPIGAGDFSLLSRNVVEAMRSAPERHRYLRGLRAWVGFPQRGIEIPRAARAGGRSKYSARTRVRIALDGLFHFSVVPVRAASVLGGVAILGSLLYVVYAVAARLLFDSSPQGFTTLIVSISFLAGVQLLFLGVIGEYVGRIYDEVKQRPHYVLRNIRRRSDGP